MTTKKALIVQKEDFSLAKVLIVDKESVCNAALEAIRAMDSGLPHIGPIQLTTVIFSVVAVMDPDIAVGSTVELVSGLYAAA